ncbi:MAG: hypothetical protein MK185_13085 [Saccharospirillaceae bacterium]|jgi:hypothetical protein|nr:hypothetical protein [Saccharospirillaceae bacterium]
MTQATLTLFLVFTLVLTYWVGFAEPEVVVQEVNVSQELERTDLASVRRSAVSEPGLQ